MYKELSEIKKKIDELKEREEWLKLQISNELKSNDLKQIKNEFCTISWVEGSTTETIDLKKLEEKEPDLYADLLEDYSKKTERKGYFKFMVK